MVLTDLCPVRQNYSSASCLTQKYFTVCLFICLFEYLISGLVFLDSDAMSSSVSVDEGHWRGRGEAGQREDQTRPGTRVLVSSLARQI